LRNGIFHDAAAGQPIATTAASPTVPRNAPPGVALNELCLRRRPHTDVKLAKLRLADFRGCIGEWVGCSLGLRKSDDLADAIGACHEHGEPVDAEGDAA